MSKEVFILGAGFSYPAKLPLQKDLLSILLEDKDFQYLNHYEKVESFLNDFFKDNFDLEDIFTILDRAYLYEENFSKYNWMEVFEVRRSLMFLIINLIDKQITKAEKHNKLYKKFIENISNNHKDISIITLNWDTLLEKLIKKFSPNMMLDYCFYTYGYNDKNHIPHINLKSQEKQNLKIIKIHGSINWLICPNCQRLIVDDSSIKSIGIENFICEYCEKYSGLKINLENFIVTPTILKKFDNLHLKYIWNNAFIELQEADKITFIGYSLPKADYEFLYLLKKVLVNKQIRVILARSDKGLDIETRYRNLFDNIEFCFDGFEKCYSERTK